MNGLRSKASKESVARFAREVANHEALGQGAQLLIVRGRKLLKSGWKTAMIGWMIAI